MGIIIEVLQQLYVGYYYHPHLKEPHLKAVKSCGSCSWGSRTDVPNHTACRYLTFKDEPKSVKLCFGKEAHWGGDLHQQALKSDGASCRNGNGHVRDRDLFGQRHRDGSQQVGNERSPHRAER